VNKTNNNYYYVNYFRTLQLLFFSERQTEKERTVLCLLRNASAGDLAAQWRYRENRTGIDDVTSTCCGLRTALKRTEIRTVA